MRNVGVIGQICRRGALAIGLACTVCAAPGCVLGNRPTLVHRGSRPEKITFYLDGAGNYGFGKESVPLGLADGGYQGHVEHFIWTTYLGAVVDQISLQHNRREGAKLARRIEEHLSRYPDGEVNIIALSAGTGVAVFALETLRPGLQVDNVVLLSSSLSADYDLTAALRHVRGGMWFFWSPNDPILQGVVPIVGTVDRSPEDSPPAGTWGAHLPRGASETTRELYRKRVHNQQWTPDSELGPLRLRHAGSISRGVIRSRVAPILVARARPATQPASPPTPRPTFTTPQAPPVTPGSRRGNTRDY